MRILQCSPPIFGQERQASSRDGGGEGIEAAQPRRLAQVGWSLTSFGARVTTGSVDTVSGRSARGARKGVRKEAAKRLRDAAGQSHRPAQILRP